VYFRLRKRGETQAQVVATAAVFLITWATHSYQWFWLRGDVLFVKQGKEWRIEQM